jgi:hypothetical protein
MKIFTNFANFDMQKCQGVSPSIDHRDTYYSSLDSSLRGASNGGQFMSLASLDGKLFVFCCFETFANSFLSIDPRDMKRLPFDSFRQDESNELRFIIFQSQDGEITRFEVFAENENFYQLRKF